MKQRSARVQLKRDFRRLFRSMDFITRHPALNKKGPEAEQLAELYQQLGQLWEFLALQCPHRDGWRKAAGGKRACKLCGKIQGTDEYWLLLPRTGKKIIGPRATPTSKETFPNKRSAQVVSDEIQFHGAKIEVDVHNSYRSRLFRGKDWAVSAERTVRLEENGIECRLDMDLITLRLEKHQRGSEPPFSAFVSELPKRALNRFPVMIEYDRRGRFVGLTIFRPDRKTSCQ